MGWPQLMTTFWAWPSGTVTRSAVFGATGVNRSPRAPLSPLCATPVAAPDGVAAAACGAPELTTVPAVAAATVTTAAVRSIERRLSAPAMTSPTYSLELVLGTSWKQASPQRNRQVSAARPPLCEPISGSVLRTLFLPFTVTRA